VKDGIHTRQVITGFHHPRVPQQPRELVAREPELRVLPQRQCGCRLVLLLLLLQFAEDVSLAADRGYGIKCMQVRQLCGMAQEELFCVIMCDYVCVSEDEPTCVIICDYVCASEDEPTCVCDYVCTHTYPSQLRISFRGKSPPLLLLLTLRDRASTDARASSANVG